MAPILDVLLAKERTPCRHPHPNNETYQHCRPKPNPSSTAAPIHHDPAHSDASHQDAQRETLAHVHARGGGRVHVEEGQVLRLPPEPPDTHQEEQGPHQPAPTGGGRANAQGQPRKETPVSVPVQGGGRVQQDEQQGQGQEAEPTKEGTPRRKLLANNKTCQHCRPKPSPSSTAAPIHTNPVHSDVRHQMGLDQPRA